MGKYALLIGVGEYGEGLTSLPAAPRDVAAFTEVLQNPQMGGFDEVKPVINPNQAEMAREIELWFQGREPDDLVLLFFSGHGVKDDRRNLFFAARNTEKQRDSLIRSTATSAQFILNCIRWCKAKYQVIILDCCYSGAFGDFLARDDGEINLKEQLGAEGCVVLTATNSVDYAYEEKGADLSIYTRYLVEGIVSGAADEDEDGMITVEELHRFAGRKVEAASPAMSPKIITLKDEGYRIRLARSPQDDPKVKYRKEAERRAESGQFSIPAKRLLLSRRQELALSEAEAEAIEAEVLKPFQEYQRKRQEYEEILHKCLQEEVTLNPNVIRDLIDFRNHLGLKPSDVIAIDQDLLGVSLENYQSETERQREEQVQATIIEKLQRYREGFTKAIEAGYPLDQYVRDGLKKFQSQLQLSDEEVIAIEKPILAAAETECQQKLKVQEENSEKEKGETEQKQQPAVTTIFESFSSNRPLEKIDDDISSERFTANYYAKLRDLLAAKDWKTADQETAHRMLEVMDRHLHKERCLRAEDIRKFPCLDLRNIDSLWVKYSHGHFGFSVQKEIWQSCDSPTLYFKHIRDWEKFGDMVGWKDPKGLSIPLLAWSWYTSSKYIFSSEAPVGHLPSGNCYGYYRLFDPSISLKLEGFSSLFSRTLICGL
jgi:uncharacterized caspase-like protein